MNNPDLAQFSRCSTGRSHSETLNPDLLLTIQEIVSAGAAAHGRRRSEQLSSVKTLDNLCDSLIQFEYTLIRSALYLRFQPHIVDSAQAKRNVKTVLVKLKRAENNNRKTHMDRNFAFTTNEYVKEICTIFGPNLVFFLAVDVKASL